MVDPWNWRNNFNFGVLLRKNKDFEYGDIHFDRFFLLFNTGYSFQPSQSDFHNNYFFLLFRALAFDEKRIVCQ